MDKNTGFVKAGCYASNITMAVVGNLSPLLFLTFHSLYGISYSLLGLLVLINFCTQLGVDLLFSFFSHKFNIPLAVKLSPVFGGLGMAVYGLYPFFFPDSVYVGLVIGTVLFAAGSGLVEVLISPVIAALPSDDPDREMSKLHSIYAWGVVGVVAVTTAFLLLLGEEYWQYLALLFILLPVSAIFFFSKAKLPEMKTEERVSGALRFFRNPLVWLSVAGIFLGGAAEVTMAQWASGYLELVGIPKVWGDLFGVAMFAVMLGLGRSMYAKFGKNISTVLFAGAIGATLCYLTAAFSGIPMIGLAACALTGLCVSMMWPGSLIVASDRFPDGGVLIFALMAAGGDFGASVGPQLVGIVTDAALEQPALLDLAKRLALSPEQLGMRLGMLVGMMFPLMAIFVYFSFFRANKKKKTDEKV